MTFSSAAMFSDVVTNLNNKNFNIVGVMTAMPQRCAKLLF